VRVSITGFVSQVHKQTNREVEDIEGLNKRLEEGGELPGGDCEGPSNSTVRIIALQLLLH